MRTERHSHQELGVADPHREVAGRRRVVRATPDRRRTARQCQLRRPTGRAGSRRRRAGGRAGRAPAGTSRCASRGARRVDGLVAGEGGVVHVPDRRRPGEWRRASGEPGRRCGRGRCPNASRASAIRSWRRRPGVAPRSCARVCPMSAWTKRYCPASSAALGDERGRADAVEDIDQLIGLDVGDGRAAGRGRSPARSPQRSRGPRARRRRRVPTRWPTTSRTLAGMARSAMSVVRT